MGKRLESLTHREPRKENALRNKIELENEQIVYLLGVKSNCLYKKAITFLKKEAL